jgi:hypothetical protein
MMSLQKFFLISMLALPVFSIAGELAEIDTRYIRYHESHYVNDDLTDYTIYDTAKKILEERAVEDSKEETITFSTSIEKAEILEAYTLKADGRRIDAPQTNYQVRSNTGKDKNSPVFSDRTSLTVVFPEVAMGDTVVFKYKVTETEPMFPGQYTSEASLSPGYAYDDVQVELNLPQSLEGVLQVRDMSRKESVRDGRRIYHFGYKNPKPKKITRRNYSVWEPDSTPGYSYSTFKSYKEIVDAYAARALPKVVVNERIRKLAKEIIGGEKDSREQARLLYEWVAQNITYAGHCIGVGAVVPHDIGFILDNRMGDCKDKATLLNALFKAENIRSTQALINAGSSYKLPAIPQVSAVNHVINYLPDYDLFVDATSEDLPFGMLAFSISDKPVLLVDGYTENRRTPASPIGRDRQTTKSTLTIHPDGSLSGSTDIELGGRFAVNARTGFRKISRQDEEEWLKNIFSNEGHIGKGRLKKDDPKPLLDHYRYSVDFETKNFIQYFGAGAFYIYTPMPTEAAIGSFLGLDSEIDEVDVACGGASSREEYVYHLPDDMEILAMPDDMQIEESFIAYSASYKAGKNTLAVKRAFDDKTPGNVCSPDLIKKQREAIQKIIRNIKSQVVYKIHRRE